MVFSMVTGNGAALREAIAIKNSMKDFFRTSNAITLRFFLAMSL